MTALSTLKNGYAAFERASEQRFASLSQLGLRLAAAQVFLSSGLSKWNGWFDFNEQKYDVFLYEFFCPDPVRPGATLRRWITSQAHSR